MPAKVSYTVFFVSVLGLFLGGTASAELVGWWKLDETSGTITQDSSGNGLNGTCQGNVAWVAGKVGGAWQGDGTGDYIRVPHNPILMIQNAITVSAWLNHQAAPADQVICKSAGTGTGWQSNYAIRLDNEGPRRINWRGRNTANQSLTSTGLLPQNEWAHVACTFDMGAGLNKIFINGVLDSENASTLPLNPGDGDLFIGADQYPANTARWWFQGMLDDVRIYDEALTQEQIAVVMRGGVLDAGAASSPDPADKAADVQRDVVLSWTPGPFAATHDVYFGTSFADVNSAGTTSPLLLSRTQAGSTYDPGRLDIGQSYFWRIDEVNAPPSSTVFKGDVWSFTVEPVAYAIPGAGITAAASSSWSSSSEPQKTVDGSGLNASDLHSTNLEHMWLSSFMGPQPTWIEFQFDKVYSLHEMWVWNQNQAIELAIGYGFKDVSIEHSVDGVAYTPLGTGTQFAQAPGTPDYAHNTTVDLSGITAKSVKLTANSNWGGLLAQYGLSEVRFFSIPVFAREPNPASGATGIDVDATLSWRAGREAAGHDVYLSTDEQAVINGTAPVTTAAAASYGPLSLDLASTYYWRVDEVNDLETPTTWQGDTWSLLTQEYLVVDDFESYNDIETGKEGSNLVYDTWADGYVNPTVNGSTIGYTVPFEPTVEKAIVYDGRQSVPLFYNNMAASLSEITANVADLQAGQDWAKHGIKGLTLRFRGDPNNVPQQLYVKINGTKVLYDGSAEDTRLPGWQMWYIDLASLGVNLSNVATLTIGLERIGGTGGQGKVLLDGIRLYSHDRQLIIPADPGTANLAGHWTFDEGSGTTAADSAANKNSGVLTGAQPVAGRVGGALKFNGAEYVEIPPTAWSSVERQVTVAFWAYGDPAAQPQAGFIFGAFQDPAIGDSRVASSDCPWSNGTVYFDTGGTAPASGYDRIFKAATPVEYEGSWQHWTCTKNADTGEQSIYLNGALWQTATGMTRPMRGVAAFTIGCRPGRTNYYVGMIDDFRLYNRALSQEEIASLAGRTAFDKGF